MVIYPDDFSFADAGVGAMPFGANYAVKQIDADEWEALENVGCVFIPMMMRGWLAGRISIQEATMGTESQYWCATARNASQGNTIHLEPGRRVAYFDYSINRADILPVRLAQDY